MVFRVGLICTIKWTEYTRTRMTERSADGLGSGLQEHFIKGNDKAPSGLWRKCALTEKPGLQLGLEREVALICHLCARRFHFILLLYFPLFIIFFIIFSLCYFIVVIQQKPVHWKFVLRNLQAGTQSFNLASDFHRINWAANPEV